MSQGHAKILAEASSLNPSALVELLILDASAIGGGILRFHPGTNAQSLPLVFRGESYAPLPVQTVGFSMSGSGEVPRPAITFANLLGTFTGLSRAYGDLVSARVIRRLVFARNLDGQPEADPREMFQEDIYFIERKLKENRQEVTYEMVPSTDIDGARIPRRQVIAASCVWRYRSPIGCAFSSNIAVAGKDNVPLPSGQTFRSDVASGEWKADAQYYTRDVVFLWQDFEKTTKTYYYFSGDRAQGEDEGPLQSNLWLMDQCSHRLSGCKRRFDPKSIVEVSVVVPGAIAAGGYHSLILYSDGRIVAWGAGTSNTGSWPNYGQSMVPLNLESVSAIAAGFTHSLVLTASGKVLAWGQNDDGQSSVPTLPTAVAIGTGVWHNLAVLSDGTVAAWGRNSSGQCNVPAGLTGVIAVTGGYYDSLALKSDGTVVKWGGGAAPPAGLTNVTAISAGADHSLALKSDGTVVGWGSDSFGQSSGPASATGVVAIAAGNFNTLLAKNDGTVQFYGWPGTVANSSAGSPSTLLGPIPSLASGARALALARGFLGQPNVAIPHTYYVFLQTVGNHAVSLASNGILAAWGRNDFGQTQTPATPNYTPSTFSPAPTVLLNLPFGGFPGSSRIPR